MSAAAVTAVGQGHDIGGEAVAADAVGLPPCPGRARSSRTHIADAGRISAGEAVDVEGGDFWPVRVFTSMCEPDTAS